MREIPTFPKSKPLEVTDRQEIEKITSRLLPYSDFHFPILWCWDIHEPAHISKLRENLVLSHSDCYTGKSFYSIIGTDAIPYTIDDVSLHIDKKNLDTTLKWLPEETYKLCNGQAAFFKEDLDSNDYIYDLYKLSEPKGEKFAGYRWKINKFSKSNSNIKLIYLEMSDSGSHDLLLDFYQLWADKKNSTATYEYNALKKLLDSYKYFVGLKTVALFTGQKLVAFAVLDFMNKDYGCIPFLKADPDFTGAAQYIIKQAADIMIQKGMRYLNLESDLGIPTLRFSKLEYRPLTYLKKYSIDAGTSIHEILKHKHEPGI